MTFTPTELFWCAALWLCWVQHRAEVEAACAEFFARYNTPAFRRLEALTLRESPLMARIRRGGA